MWGIRNRQYLPIELVTIPLDERTFFRVKRIMRRLMGRKGKHRHVWEFRVGCWGMVAYPEAVRMLINAELWRDDGIIC